MLVKSNLNTSDQNEFCLELDNEPVKNVNVTKYLGVNVDSNLKFDKHIHEVIKNITCKLSWLGRLQHVVPRNILELTYRTYIIPLFDYACTVWGCTNANVKLIQRLQNRAARIITGCYDVINVRGIDLVKTLKWLNMQD